MAGNPPPPPPEPDLLFMKKLSRRDVFNGAAVLSEAVVEVHEVKMMIALQTLVQERRCFFLPIRAEDPMGDSYELRFAVNPDGNYVVFHQWGKVVAINDLRVGDTVKCLGNFAGDDSEIHATLKICWWNQDSKLKVPLTLPTEMQGPEYIPDSGGSPKLLFEKILDDGDSDRFLAELQFRRCNKSLRMALEETPSIRVFTVNPHNDNVELARLTITRYVIQHAWREVMNINGLKKGDTVLGYGNPVGWGDFRLQLYVLRDKPPSPDAKRRMPDEGLKTEEEKRLVTLLLLEKGTDVVLGRVVIQKEQAGVEAVWGMERDDAAGGFAMFSVKRVNGSRFEWSEEVDEYGVSKTVGGAAVANDNVRVHIDVYKNRF